MTSEVIRTGVVGAEAKANVAQARIANPSIGCAVGLGSPPFPYAAAEVGRDGLPRGGFDANTYLLLNRHFMRNHFLAAGGDKRAARFAGINVVWTKTVAFVLCSMFATTSGIFQMVRSSKAETNPQLFIELFAVAVCFMGGLSLFGGRGSVIGIALGAALLQLVQDVIILMRLLGFYLDMFVGMMIVFGVTLTMAVRKRY